ncbi:MAG: EamA family transporter [Acidobacteriota bacterium]
MIPALLALLSSVTYGSADFLGGLSSRRASTTAVVIVSQLAGLVLLALAMPLLPPSSVTVIDLAWGAAAGLSGGIGVALLYRGLAIGPMSVVAPVTAVCAVIVPVLVGIFSGEALSMLTGAGIVLAATAIVLVGQAPTPAGSAAKTRPGARAFSAVSIAIASGVVIGLFLVALERTPASAGMWPLIAARVVSISLFGIVALARPAAHSMSRGSAATAVLGGSFDMLANVLYLAAVRQGQLSVIATLTSLYPASTVLLARVVLGERLGFQQKVGVAGAVVAAMMIVHGAVR